jgi:hypothetical protein
MIEILLLEIIVVLPLKNALPDTYKSPEIFTGPVNVGAVPNTTGPVPVSSAKILINAELEIVELAEPKRAELENKRLALDSIRS